MDLKRSERVAERVFKKALLAYAKTENIFAPTKKALEVGCVDQT